MAAALALVLEHVKARQAFGQPLGAFQAIQHRLAMASEVIEGTRYLALRAAWSDSDADAALAAGFAQHHIPQLTYDLHQFCGAMGLTLEFPLHLFTYRLRALLGELGGSSAQLSGLQRLGQTTKRRRITCARAPEKFAGGSCFNPVVADDHLSINPLAPGKGSRFSILFCSARRNDANL